MKSTPSTYRCHLLQLALFGVCVVSSLCILVPSLASAATLAVTPATGVYKTGQTFTVNIMVNTAGVPVNAADGTISFNPRELSVVAVSRASSIFNLWTAEPAFSNANGSITFSGGVPTGYTGAGGVVMSATFKSLTSGAARVTISGASVLAADGRGTNVLTNMSGGTYTLAAVDTQPAPEVIVEYVAPANTPAAPKITSASHTDPTKWYTADEAVLQWEVVSSVTAVRTSLDTAPISVPTKVYDTPIKTITLKDLPEGVSYFHIQFKNADGWGKVAHYRLAVDSEKPKSVTLSSVKDADFSNPVQKIDVAADDAASPVLQYKIQIDGGEAYEHTSTSSTFVLTLPSLEPGAHTILVEAFDSAGNSLITTYTLTISAFEKPIITDYPTELAAGVIPVIKGTTRPNATVKITLSDAAGTITEGTTTSTGTGDFTYIPNDGLALGVYSVTAVAIDAFGAQSAPSDTVKIVVKKPGYLVVGSWLVSVMSILIPLLGLALLGWMLIIYGLHRVALLKKRLRKEAGEATAMAEHEFLAILNVLDKHETALLGTRKTGKLTAAEAALFADIRAVTRTAEANVEKEVADVTALVKK